MRGVGGGGWGVNCLKYSKRGSRRKEVRGNKDKKRVPVGSRGMCFKKGVEPPYKL